jgi:hypothetical protein
VFRAELTPFLDAIARADAPLEGKANGWQRKAVLAEFGNACAFCSAPLDLASPSLGRLRHWCPRNWEGRLPLSKTGCLPAVPALLPRACAMS